MEKVPVGRSVSHAYEFLFGRFFQIVGTAWLPALLYGLGSYYLLSNMQPWMPLRGADAGTVVKTLGFALGTLAFALIIRSVVGISLTQEALGVRKDLTLAHFVVGPRELRLFFAMIRYYILFFVLYVVVIAICLGAMFAAKKYGAGLAPNLKLNGMPLATVAAALLCLVVTVWFALAMLRLQFLLPPVASVEHRTRLMRAWTLTRGSGWRVLLVYIGALLPVMVAAGIAAYFLLGPNDLMNLMAEIRRARPGNPPPIAPFYAAHAFVLAAFGTVLTILNGALLAGASAAAYRTTTGHEEPDAEDDAALVAPLLAPVHADEPADHGHGHDDHGHGHGHGDGHGGHDDHGHGGGHDDHGHGGGHGDGHGHDAAHGGGHDDGHGHDDDDDDGDDHDDGHDDGHGHDGDHGHGDHGHGDHGHHAKAA
ncbi:MAG TPA: hypothetical protein VNU97_03710 [Rhizomicrobium sp.]|jgi:hypothetical protein|nr:hypothetical protein [Rhizomicrobium sp.]